jgi:hypothetical protein
LVWNEVPNAEFYGVVLEKRDSLGNWKIIKKENSWPNIYFPLGADLGKGDFRISVIGKNDRFFDSKEMQFDFVRGPEASADPAKSTTEKSWSLPVGYAKNSSYLWGLGLNSSTFSMLFQDSFNAGTSSAYELFVQDSIPMPSLESNLELRGQTDVYSASGITIDMSYLHGLFRRGFSSSGQSTIGAGLFVKEMPLVANSPAGQFPNIFTLRTAGPILSLGTQGNLFSSYHWNLDLSILLHLLGLNLPNGRSNILPTYGYKLESKFYFAKVYKSPVYVGLNYFFNSAQFANLAGDTSFVTGKPLSSGSMSYGSESSVAVMLGSDFP